MKKSRTLKIPLNWDELPEKVKEDLEDCEFVLMANEIDDLPENTAKEKMFKSLQLQGLQKIKKGNT
jgi:hypothetical protein